MKLLLTLLGTGNYEPCCYDISGKVSSGVTYFCHALAAHIAPNKVFSLQTHAAEKKHGKQLDAGFGDLNITHEAITIPDGKNETELWELFQRITENVPQNCILHLDITHGFRSLPLLSFLALSYLRSTRNITIGGIHYGAWDARQSNNIAPAFDLSPFLTLLDWTTAADQFLYTGDAARIGSLLRDAHRMLWKTAKSENSADLPKLLSSLGSTIEEAASDRILLRTSNLEQSAAAVNTQLDRISKTTELEKYVPAFLQILEPVKAELTQHKASDLKTLRDLIQWLVQRNHPDTALTLAAEWMVCWLMVKNGEPDRHSAYESRKPYEDALNQMIQQQAGKKEINLNEHAQKLIRSMSTEESDRLVSVASRIKSARNDLNHAGFRNDPLSAKKIYETASKVANELNDFAVNE